MAVPRIKFAVYYGTITLDNGSTQTLTPVEVATLYGVEGEDYLSVPLDGPFVWPGKYGESEYVPLKPLADARYFDAIERYNANDEVQDGEDFDAYAGGRWAEKPRVEDDR